ncbi:hypothetical protein [Cronobacter condimenti]|uniref:hypothetical protein n=1 Tax=Cronobacter condimenti TaxID=1163710 RepID=UPI0002EDD622|nr:hypothetical protein [Cronobacter condimenti]
MLTEEKGVVTGMSFSRKKRDGKITAYAAAPETAMVSRGKLSGSDIPQGAPGVLR